MSSMAMWCECRFAGEPRPDAGGSGQSIAVVSRSIDFAPRKSRRAKITVHRATRGRQSSPGRGLQTEATRIPGDTPTSPKRRVFRTSAFDAANERALCETFSD